MMKKLLLSIIAMLIVFISNAQSPESFKYQAVVRDASGNVLANQNVGMQIRILKTTAGGTVVYSETHTPTTNAFGLVNLSVGGGTVVSGVGANNIDQFSIAEVRSNSNGELRISNIRMFNEDPLGLTRMAITSDTNKNFTLGITNSNFQHGPKDEAYLWYFDNFDFKIATNNTEKFRITNTGNVGIGTAPTSVADPTPVKSKLHVAGGDVYIDNIGSGVIMKSPNGNCWRMAVDNNGNVVVNQVNPCP